jgi:hypothetical protein
MKTRTRLMIVLTMLLAIASSCKKDHDIPTGKVFNEGSVDGAINGLFSVSTFQQVYFSKGNLQYIGSANTPYWKFADHQWDYLGYNGQENSNQNVDRDLFGWGTSGYNHGAVCYQPWSTSTTNSDYYAYGSDTYNLFDQTGQADWGYNAISNEGNMTHIWRTLTREEWEYLFNTRNTSSGIRYAKAKVNNINGVILLPDDWQSFYYSLSSTNSTGASYSSNTITATQWDTLEQHGAVFLPAAGSRYGTSVSYVGGNGDYWSASCSNSINAWLVDFDVSNLGTGYSSYRSSGRSVRLVYCSHATPTVATIDVTNITQTTATGGGNVTATGIADVTERGICWSTSHNPTTSGSHASSGTGTGSFTVEMTGLTANTTYYVRAYAKNSAGTVYGSEVSFTTLTAPTAPIGYIEGLFSVSATQQVYFSKGNLQYRASTNTWQFAEHQWDYVGEDNSNISQTYNGWIDLFGWGTSGYNHGAACYQPWSTSDNYNDYYAYGSDTYNLYDQTGQADWGYNAISNGGNTPHTWRTLTHGEWRYVFNTRNTSSGIRYAKAKVNNINGVILLPDDWQSSYYSLSSTNSSGASFSSNIITATQWATLEQYGAVFLPAAGDRNGASVGSVGSNGGYWSASCYHSDIAWRVYFDDSSLSTGNYYYRDSGQSLRLVFSPQ